MQVQTMKSQYTAPEARRSRIRPFTTASVRRSPVITWKDSAQAALGDQVQARTAFVIAEMPVTGNAVEGAPMRRQSALRVVDLLQVVAPALIALCAIAQLAQSIR